MAPILVFLNQTKTVLSSYENILTINANEQSELPFPLYLNPYLKALLTVLLLATLIKGAKLRCLILSSVTWKESKGSPINYLICVDQINALCWAVFILARIAFMLSPLPISSLLGENFCSAINFLGGINGQTGWLTPVKVKLT